MDETLPYPAPIADRRSCYDKMAKFAQRPTRKTAIDAMCMQCMGGPDNPGWTRLILECSAGPESQMPCPLWGYRPYRDKS